MKRSLATAAFTVAALGFSTTAQAGTIRHGTDQGAYETLATLFPSVGRLQLVYEGVSSPSTCSGTLIAPTLVLTAAHCVEFKQEQNNVINYRPFKAGYFTLGNAGAPGNSYYSITGGVIKREYQSFPNRNVGLRTGYDLAVLELIQEVSNVTPASLYVSRDENGKIGNYVGFGRSGDGLTGAVEPPGTKRAGQNVISTNTGNPRLLASDFDNPNLFNNPFYEDLFDGKKLPLPYEYNIAPGDSGGGLFIGQGADAKLAGVNSFTLPPGRNGKYGAESYTTRVSSWTTWVDNVKRGLQLTPSPTPNRYTHTFTPVNGTPAPVVDVIPLADNDTMPYESGFDNLFEAILIADTFSNEEVTNPGGGGNPNPTPVPTPALLPGLIGLGISAWRKRKAM
jgi:Trypsin